MEEELPPAERETEREREREREREKGGENALADKGSGKTNIMSYEY